MGVGTGISPPPSSRHNSLPVAKSYPPVWCQPLTTIWVRPAVATMVGLPQVGTSRRGVRQSSLPDLMSKVARKELVCTSQSTITLPSRIIGELAKPHCAEGTAKKPESIGPKSFFQRSFPSVSKQKRPSEQKIATM